MPLVSCSRVVPCAFAAGAALIHLDLALWLIRNNSPELAALVTKYLFIDTRLSQSAHAISAHLAHSDPLVERLDPDSVIFASDIAFWMRSLTRFMAVPIAAWDSSGGVPTRLSTEL